MEALVTITGLVYLAVGAAFAWAWIPFDERAFWFRRLPKNWLNRLLASITVVLILIFLWPLYWRIRMSHKQPASRDQHDRRLP